MSGKGQMILLHLNGKTDGKTYESPEDDENWNGTGKMKIRARNEKNEQRRKKTKWRKRERELDSVRRFNLTLFNIVYRMRPFELYKKIQFRKSAKWMFICVCVCVHAKRDKNRKKKKKFKKITNNELLD